MILFIRQTISKQNNNNKPSIYVGLFIVLFLI